jgi:GNAT superfamily N-acetyltransferase
MKQDLRPLVGQIQKEITTRRYQLGEEKILQEIYSESTRRLNSKDYTPEQIERWVEKHADPEEWVLRLKGTNPFVVAVAGTPVAFGELEANGHIDFFYCHPDHVGQGAGALLFKAITAEALRLGLSTLHAEVSVTAQPFFTKMGFQIIEERAPIICGAPAKQFIMSKQITAL